MNNKKRVLTLLSGIFTIIIGIALAVLSIGLFYFMASQQSSEIIFLTLGLSLIFEVLISIFILVFSILFIVCGVIQIRASENNMEFYERKGWIITFIFLDVFVIICEAFALTSQVDNQAFLIIFSALLSSQIICLILKIIDLIMFTVKFKKGQIKFETTNMSAPKDIRIDPTAFAQNKIDPRTFANKSITKKEETSLEEEIQKLMLLKENGTINEEEFNKLKQDLINKTLNIK